MAKTNFYLKNPKEKAETLIYLFFHYNGMRFKYSTGETVQPKFWNEETQRTRHTLKDCDSINNYLDHIESEIKRIYRESLTNEITSISKEYLKQCLDKVVKPEEASTEKGLLDYYEEYIEMQRPTKTIGTIKKCKSLLNHLRSFQFEKRYPLSFDSIDLGFYDHFTNYCVNDLKLMNNTSAKYMKMIKTFSKWALDRGYSKNVTYLKFKTREKDADIIYLTDEELFKIYNCDLSKKPMLERVRDIFCFGCFTGLRYSDIAKLRKEHIKGDEINMISEKTTDNLNIPLNGYSRGILKKYDFLLPVISIQKANDFLKDIGKAAKINEPVILTKFRGVEEIQIKKPKYEFLTTHAARRTFVTLSLEKGMRPETVMSITGHKEYRTFKKYIKITNKVKSVEMNRIWDNQPALKVV